MKHVLAVSPSDVGVDGSLPGDREHRSTMYVARHREPIGHHRVLHEGRLRTLIDSMTHPLTVQEQHFMRSLFHQAKRERKRQ